jgi:hypothetical protein
VRPVTGPSSFLLDTETEAAKVQFGYLVHITHAACMSAEPFRASNEGE